MNAATKIVSIGEARNAAASNVIDIANARNFHTYVRRATPDELRDTERELSAALAKSEDSGIRTQLVDIIKERLTVVLQALALSH